MVSEIFKWLDSIDDVSAYWTERPVLEYPLNMFVVSDIFNRFDNIDAVSEYFVDWPDFA